MSSTRDIQTTTERPTEDAPNHGVSSLEIANEKIMLSEGVWWLDESGDYVIRSTEFDVIAGGPTFDEALSRFNRALLDYARFLASIDDLADNEEEAFHRLTPRVLRLVEALDTAYRAERRRLVSINLSRRRRTSRGQWQPAPRQLGSRLPSRA